MVEAISEQDTGTLITFFWTFIFLVELLPPVLKVSSQTPYTSLEI